MNYLVGIKKENINELFINNYPEKKFKTKEEFDIFWKNQPFEKGQIFKNLWSGYKAIKSDTIIWIRRLKGDGDVIAKAKIISDFRKNNENKKTFDIEIIEKCSISTKEIFKDFGVTSNANHGYLRER